MLATTTFILLVAGTSCNRDDRNHEAEIEAIHLKETVALGNPTISGINIIIYVSTDADITKLSPEFKLSKGSTITPESGSTQDFSKPVKYTVLSEDGELSRTFSISVRKEAILSNNFDSWKKIQTDPSSEKSIYYTPADNDWSTANVGNVLLRVLGFDVANTVDQTTESFQGEKAAIIRTEFVSDKPVFGMKTPIATGSLFLGAFTTNYLMSDPLKCTQFGVPITRKPLKVTGYYKYHPGDNFTDENFTIIPQGKDSCAIYAVLYKGKEPLNGHNVLSDTRIIAKSVLKSGKIDTFTKFELNLNYPSNADLHGDLMFTIVFSSSWDGNIFKGAVGSTLYIDDVTVETATIE